MLYLCMQKTNISSTDTNTYKRKQEFICNKIPLIQHQTSGAPYCLAIEESSYKTRSYAVHNFQGAYWFHGLTGTYWTHPAIEMASKDPNMCKQVSAGNKKHVTLMILRELYVIGRLNSGKSRREVMASHIRLSTI